MKVSLTILALVTTMELVLGVPVYGPPQPLPIPQKYRSPNGAPIPAKYPPHLGSHSGKNEFYSKFSPHSLPPGLRGPAPQLPPPFAKYPNLPPPGKHQQQYQQQNQFQHQHQLQHQPQQHQVHHHPQQQQQQQQHQQQPHHSPASSRPIGPQFQSKPHLLQNIAPHHPPQQGQVNNGADQRVQLAPSRPTPKITNVWTGPKLSGSPDFPPRFPTAATNIAPVTAVPFLEKPRGPYIINSDDERGPIKTIPAPNLNPADKPANFEEQLYRAQHQQSYVQPLDNSITDEKLSYQVTEVPNVNKQIGSQPSPTLESNPVPAVPLDIALQQHLDNQHQQQLSAEQVGSTGTLTPQELYSLLNGSPAGPAVVPQTTYMVQQPVVYAVPQSQSLDLQVGHQLQYQPQLVQLQYAAQQPAATGVQLQYAQPAAADLQYLQPQTVQYHPQAVQYQPQTVQYQVQPEQQQQYQQQSAEQYNGAQKTATAAELSAQKQQQQQELIQQQQEQEQERQEHEQQQQREQLNQQQQQAEQQLQQQQQQQQQQPENDVQYQQEQDEYEPRNKGSVADDEHDQKKLQSIRDQYYSAVPNEQTAGVLAQIAQSAANNDEPSQSDEPKAADKSPSDHQSAVQMHTSVQIQQSVPLYEATYASSRRTNQEYVDESPEADELMEGSESVAVSSESSPSSSVNGHAPNQFPYSAANINAFAAN